MQNEYYGINLDYKMTNILEINEIKKFIKQRHELIKNTIGNKISIKTNKEGYVRIDNIDDLIKLIINKIKKDLSIYDKDIVYEVLLNNYIGTLINNKTIMKPLSYSISNNKKSILCALACLYYNEKKAIEYIKNMPKDMTIEITDYLKMNYGTKLYLNSKKYIMNTLTKDDKNITKKYKEANIDLTEKVKTINVNNNIKYDKISFKELDILFEQFLKEIDKTGNWLKEYKKVKRNGNLAFYEKDDNDNLDMASYVKDDTIRIGKTNDIRDFVTLAHEFTHYISKTDLNEDPVITNEFPSIYFELIATYFLERSGYDKEQTEAMRNERLVDSYNHIKGIYEGLDKLLKENITENEILNECLEQAKIEKSMNLYLYYFSERTEKEYKELNDLQLTYEILTQKLMNRLGVGTYISKCESYIIGLSLASKMIEKNEDMGLDDMLYITNNLKSLTVDEIYNIVNNNTKSYII